FTLMALGGLAAAVGLVIDTAIVVVENIVLHRDAGQTRLQAIHSALGEITIPLIGSPPTPIVVFLPLVSITGVTGTFFRALAVTMSVALLASLALALTWTPALSQFLIKRSTADLSDIADNRSDDNEDALDQIAPEPEVESIRRLMEAEEASLSGFFRKVINFHERWLRRALERPRWLAGFSLALIVIAYGCYQFSGSGLLPEMDEGGFILDYIMPAGSSLAETNRVVRHLEQILHDIPEVESTSRRTGMQLGLASVTEANTGDISVKLKLSRSRDIEEVIADVRAKIKTEEPAIDVEFIQVLQDMISDLTGEPQPVEVKMFSQDAAILDAWAPKVADAIAKDKGVVDVLNGIDNTISGPAVVFQVDPSIAARAGFTPEEVATDAAAILEGEPSTTPVVTHDRTYTLRVRFPAR